MALLAMQVFGLFPHLADFIPHIAQPLFHCDGGFSKEGGGHEYIYFSVVCWLATVRVYVPVRVNSRGNRQPINEQLWVSFDK